MEKSLKDCLLEQEGNGVVEIPWVTDLTFEDIIYVSLISDRVFLCGTFGEYMHVKETLYDNVIQIRLNIPNTDLLILLYAVCNIERYVPVRLERDIPYNINQDTLQEWWDILSNYKMTNTNLSHLIQQLGYNVELPEEDRSSFIREYLGGANVKSARKV